jgi:hypothetical protein
MTITNFVSIFIKGAIRFALADMNTEAIYLLSGKIIF